MTSRAYHPVLHEIRDQNGNWHTGWLPFGKLAELIGTTTADLMRRLALLEVVERRGGRHRLTRLARQKGYGTTYRRKSNDKGQRLEMDVVLPEGMVRVVQNLEATNLAETEEERLRGQGLSQRDIANRLGISQQAVQKRLAGIIPRLKDWPVVGNWGDDDNHFACA